jgi:hypothetical protein
MAAKKRRTPMLIGLGVGLGELIRGGPPITGTIVSFIVFGQL